MASLAKGTAAAVAIAGVHVIFLLSVFDIYFKSPVVDVGVTHAPDYTAPARRLVLVVADGLRADALFSNRRLAPFLTGGIVDGMGAWGVSHTRVPTESRPGHVALIAGMYEDPSAITKGWQENPADFDTAFNQSRYTWGWGSPDILPMFAKGVTGDRMQYECYAPEFEDFSASDLTQLDTWVFDRVDAFFERARDDVDLQMKLREDKLVLFLHLLGLDTNGHRNKPNSAAYRENVRVVDDGVRRLVDSVNRHWRHDGRTAFVFTADHGMTDWGSHGAGMAHETETPLIAWGAGIRWARNASSKPTSPERWDMGNLERVDVDQADIAPLMSSLIGAAVPKNSVGRLPVDYLDMHPEHKLEASLAVARQVNEQLRHLRAEFETAWIHRPFEELDDESFGRAVDKIRLHAGSGKHGQALRLSQELYSEALRGVEYYQRYFRTQLYVAVSLSYVGFIVLVAATLLTKFTPFAAVGTESNGYLVDVISAVVGVSVSLFALGQNTAYHYLIYYLCPVALWNLAAKEVSKLRLRGSINRTVIVQTAAILVCLELVVVTFFRREALAAVIAAVTIMQLKSASSSALWIKLAWVALNTGLCVTALQPSIGKEHNTMLVVIAGLLSALIGIMAWWPYRSSRHSSPACTYLLAFYLCLSGICVQQASDPASALVPMSAVHAASWLIFVTGMPASLVLTRPYLLSRLLSVCMALQAAYLLLSLSYEGLFLLCLMNALLVWLAMERDSGLFRHHAVDTMALSKRERNVIDFRDVVRSFMFLHFSVVSFFGTGNIASLNSFDPASIRCLVSVFSPFLMGGLLFAKVVLPFFVVALFGYVVRRLSAINSTALGLLVLLFSDVLGLHFFFLVTDQGSWQEIGTSLSHFVIAEATVIMLQLFYVAAGATLRFSISRRGVDDEESDDKLDQVNATI